VAAVADFSNSASDADIREGKAPAMPEARGKCGNARLGRRLALPDLTIIRDYTRVNQKFTSPVRRTKTISIRTKTSYDPQRQA